LATFPNEPGSDPHRSGVPGDCVRGASKPGLPPPPCTPTMKRLAFRRALGGHLLPGRGMCTSFSGLAEIRGAFLPTPRGEGIQPPAQRAAACWPASSAPFKNPLCRWRSVEGGFPGAGKKGGWLAPSRPVGWTPSPPPSSHPPGGGCPRPEERHWPEWYPV